jgi:hypothetical protein
MCLAGLKNDRDGKKNWYCLLLRFINKIGALTVELWFPADAGQALRFGISYYVFCTVNYPFPGALAGFDKFIYCCLQGLQRLA